MSNQDAINAARFSAERTPRYQHLLERHARLLALVDGTLGAAGDDHIKPDERAKVEAELEHVAVELAAIEWEHYDRITKGGAQ